ncbi:MAG: hypothetical protein AAF483_04285 [Planctomycetota bacterium]
MKNVGTVASAFFCCFVSLITGCTNSGNTTNSQTASEPSETWKLYASAQNNCEYQAPGEPIQQKFRAEHPLGPIEICIESIDKGEQVFQVTMTDYPKGFVEQAASTQEAVLEKAAASGLEARAGAKQIKFDAISIDRKPGYLQEYEYPEGADYPAGYAWIKGILVSDGMLLMQVDASAEYVEKNNEKCKADCKKFFDSLKMTSALAEENGAEPTE